MKLQTALLTLLAVSLTNAHPHEDDRSQHVRVRSHDGRSGDRHAEHEGGLAHDERHGERASYEESEHDVRVGSRPAETRSDHHTKSRVSHHHDGAPPEARDGARKCIEIDRIWAYRNTAGWGCDEIQIHFQQKYHHYGSAVRFSWENLARVGNWEDVCDGDTIYPRDPIPASDIPWGYDSADKLRQCIRNGVRYRVWEADTLDLSDLIGEFEVEDKEYPEYFGMKMLGDSSEYHVHFHTYEGICECEDFVWSQP